MHTTNPTTTTAGGPSPDVAALVELAVEGIRSANHRTYEPGQLTVPDTYTIIGELAALARRLPQLHQQLAAGLDHRHHLGGLHLDSCGQHLYPNPGTAITTATDALRAAAHATTQAAAALDAAHAACAVIADHGTPVLG